MSDLYEIHCFIALVGWYFLVIATGSLFYWAMIIKEQGSIGHKFREINLWFTWRYWH